MDMFQQYKTYTGLSHKNPRHVMYQSCISFHRYSQLSFLTASVLILREITEFVIAPSQESRLGCSPRWDSNFWKRPIYQC